MKKLFLLALAAVLVLPLAPASGQDGGQETELSGGYLITLPEGWEMADEDGSYTITKDDLTIRLMTPDQFSAIVTFDEFSNAANLLIEAYDKLHDQVIQRQQIDMSTTEEGQVIAVSEFEVEEQGLHAVALVMQVGPGIFAYGELSTPDVNDPNLADARQIVLSLRAGETAASGVPCAVRANNNQVELRVGPGTNRGVYTTMDTGRFIPVLGKITLKDKSLWWRLDMPTGSAKELWVADGDVETTGDCAQVADVNAPPLIPAHVPRPTLAPGEPTPQLPEGLVECPIYNLSVFTVKGTLSGPAGPYYFEVPAGGVTVLNVVPGNYNVHFFCDGCGGAGANSVWPCDGFTAITVQVTDRP